MKRLTIPLVLASLVLGIPSAGAQTPPANQATINAADYPDLQAALDAVPPEGGCVRIPPGRYEINQPLRIHTTDTRLTGAGAATQLVNTNTDGSPTIVIAHPEYGDRVVPRDRRLWRIQLDHFRVVGNPDSGSGIEAHYIEEVFIHGVTVTGHGGHGIALLQCYEDPRVSDNLITYNARDGVHLAGCHDIVVSSNQFEENRTGLRCIDSFNLTMSGNNLDDHLGDGVVIEKTYGSVVASNMIEECQGWGIILDRDCYGITLSANVIAHEFQGGIDLRDAHGCAVSANTFTIVKQAALAIRADSGRIAVTGNAFSNSYIGGQTSRQTAGTSLEKNPDEAAGILLEGTQQIVITGNLFSGLTSAAIERKGEVGEVVESGNLVVPGEAADQPAGARTP